MSDTLDNRRPLKSRSTAWARTLADRLAAAGASPDMISAGSIGFAAVGCWLFLAAGNADGFGRFALLILAGACIQLRLLCNLLDGMVAVEHGRGGTSGPIWNELPDRIADVLFLVGAGYFADPWPGWGVYVLGWLSAAMAMLTAYIRELGRGLGFPADFSGPMAKPHRMAALTAACVVSAVEPLWGWDGEAMTLALVLVVAGAAATAARRTMTLARRLRAGGPGPGPAA
jgi:phosphatidylglycerophosphate synthase